MTFTGMVYAREVEGKELTLGVSGRLLERNLLMWDPESNTLWSQILGEGIFGEREGSRLELVPAVFVGLGTWKALHPDTLVLDLSPVDREAWHYTTEHLASGRNERDQPLGIGVRSDGGPVAVSLARLHREALVEVDLAPAALAFVWLRDQRAALVYDRHREGQTLELALRGDRLVDRVSGDAFDALSGRFLGEGARPPLTRVPYIPVVTSAWSEFYSGGRVLE